MDPTLLNNLLASLRDTIFGVLTQNGTPFAQLGLNIFRTITIVMIVIAGTVDSTLVTTNCSGVFRSFECSSTDRVAAASLGATSPKFSIVGSTR